MPLQIWALNLFVILTEFKRPCPPDLREQNPQETLLDAQRKRATELDSLLFETFKEFRLVIYPSDYGINPCTLFSIILITAKETQEPTSSGMDPSNMFFCKSRSPN